MLFWPPLGATFEPFACFFPIKACLNVAYGLTAWDLLLAWQPTTSLSSWHKYPSSLNYMSVCILLQWDVPFCPPLLSLNFCSYFANSKFNVLDVLSPTHNMPLHFRRRLFTSSCRLATNNVIIDMLTYQRWRRDAFPEGISWKTVNYFVNY